MQKESSLSLSICFSKPTVRLRVLKQPFYFDDDFMGQEFSKGLAGQLHCTFCVQPMSQEGVQVGKGYVGERIPSQESFFIHVSGT